MADDPTPAEFVRRWEGELKSLQASVADPTRTATLNSSVQSLEAQLSCEASNLPAYELARCERELRKLVESIKSAQKEQEQKDGSGGGATSRPKFSFKRSDSRVGTTDSGPSAPSSTLPARSLDTSLPSAGSASLGAALSSPDSAPRQHPSVPATALTISNHSHRFLALPDISSSAPGSSSASPPSGKAGALLLSALEDCFVDLTLPDESGSAPCETLYAYGLKRCVVVLGTVEGSVMLHGCDECVFVLGSHQLRVHDSTACALHVHTKSTPVIERSKRLTFAPYPSLLEPSLSSSSSTTNPTAPAPGSGKGSYAAAQDFDYPFATASTPSPNLRFVHDDRPEWMTAQRGWSSREARTWDWKDMLSGAVSQVTKEG